MNVRRPTWDDFDAVFALVTAADIAAIGESDWTEDGLRTEWRELNVTQDGWVVELDGRIAGFATFDDRGAGRLIGDGYVDPQVRGRGVGSEILRVTEERARREVAKHAPNVRVYLQNGTIVADRCTPNLYARHGYRAAEEQYRMAVDLDAEPEVPALPGVEIRPYREPEERRDVHAVIDEAFALIPTHCPRAFDEWAPRVFERERFDPSLVWVALADGQVVGANVCGWKEGGDWGWIASIGVRPSHHGRRIGEALLKSALAEFWRRGERRVALGVSADNPTRALRLYERAGMRVLYTIVVYEKELRAAA